MSEATAVARAASEVESLFCKGRGAEKFNVESSLQIELSFEGSHMLPFGLASQSLQQLGKVLSALKIADQYLMPKPTAIFR